MCVDAPHKELMLTSCRMDLPTSAAVLFLLSEAAIISSASARALAPQPEAFLTLRGLILAVEGPSSSLSSSSVGSSESESADSESDSFPAEKSESPLSSSSSPCECVTNVTDELHNMLRGYYSFPLCRSAAFLWSLARAVASDKTRAPPRTILQVDIELHRSMCMCQGGTCRQW